MFNLKFSKISKFIVLMLCMIIVVGQLNLQIAADNVLPPILTVLDQEGYSGQQPEAEEPVSDAVRSCCNRVNGVVTEEENPYMAAGGFGFEPAGFGVDYYGLWVGAPEYQGGEIVRGSTATIRLCNDGCSIEGSCCNTICWCKTQCPHCREGHPGRFKRVYLGGTAMGPVTWKIECYGGVHRDEFSITFPLDGVWCKVTGTYVEALVISVHDGETICRGRTIELEVTRDGYTATVFIELIACCFECGPFCLKCDGCFNCVVDRCLIHWPFCDSHCDHVVTVNDYNLKVTAGYMPLVAGATFGPIHVDRGDLPAAVTITFDENIATPPSFTPHCCCVSHVSYVDRITITGVRPAHGEDPIIGTFDVLIYRLLGPCPQWDPWGYVKLTVHVNLTPLPPPMRTVTFIVQNGAVGIFATQTTQIQVPCGGLIPAGAIPTFTARRGFYFAGWYKGHPTPGTIPYCPAEHGPVTEDLTFTARFNDLFLYITFIVEDGGVYEGEWGCRSGAQRPNRERDGHRILAIPTPLPIIPSTQAHDGWTFVGWYRNGIPVNLDYGYDYHGPLRNPFYDLRTNLTFTARFARITHPVTFDLAGGNADDNEDDIVHTANQGDEIGADNVPAPVRSGFTFVGWRHAGMDDDNDNLTCDEVAAHVVTGPITFVAQWTANQLPPPVQIPVIFNLNGGNVGGDTANITRMVDLNTAVGMANVPAPVRSGYTFMGWRHAGMALGTANLTSAQAAAHIVVAEITFVAQWAPVADNGNDDTIYYPWWPQQPQPPRREPLIDAPFLMPELFDLLYQLDPMPMGTDRLAYIIGYEDGYVRPHNNITRAEVVTVFFRLMCDDYRAYVWNQDNPFPDSVSSHWFNNAISTLTNAGILTGFPDGYVRPGQEVTRAEFAALVVRVMGYGHATGIPHQPFADTAGHWAEGYINVAHALGWVQGYADGTFRPSQPITRAEVAALVNRALGRLPQCESEFADNMIIWPDNRILYAWYYMYIQEATNSHRTMVDINDILESWVELLQPREWWRLERPYSTPHIFTGAYIGEGLGSID